VLLKGFDGGHSEHKGFILVRNEALRPIPKTYEYVFLNAKVLQKAYNRRYTSYSAIGRECLRKGKMIIYSPINWRSIKNPLEEGLAPLI
jgi:uncharacterized protein YfaA (DUF2138 family)